MYFASTEYALQRKDVSGQNNPRTSFLLQSLDSIAQNHEFFCDLKKWALMLKYFIKSIIINFSYLVYNENVNNTNLESRS